uniref:Uncharacterized protein n=1 Tax=Lygus hesperus TaxID=30085 RepID=A0A0A9Z1C6_LYGHE
MAGIPASFVTTTANGVTTAPLGTLLQPVFFSSNLPCAQPTMLTVNPMSNKLQDEMSHTTPAIVGVQLMQQQQQHQQQQQLQFNNGSNVEPVHKELANTINAFAKLKT